MKLKMLQINNIEQNEDTIPDFTTPDTMLLFISFNIDNSIFPITVKSATPPEHLSS